MRNIIIFILIFSFTCFAGEYLKEGKSIYYMKDGQMVSFYFVDGTVDPAADCYSKPSKILLDNVDLDTFKSLNLGYAKDKNSVYIYNKKIKSAAPESFHTLSGLYAKDANHVYFEGAIIDKADAPSFETLDFSYAKDKKNVYYLKTIIKNYDIISHKKEAFL